MYILPEEETQRNEQANKQSAADNSSEIMGVGGAGYTLFLIFVLLLISSQSSIGPYFQILETEVNKINETLSLFSETASGLKRTFEASQKI